MSHSLTLTREEEDTTHGWHKLTIAPGHNTDRLTGCFPRPPSNSKRIRGYLIGYARSPSSEPPPPPLSREKIITPILGIGSFLFNVQGILFFSEPPPPISGKIITPILGLVTFSTFSGNRQTAQKFFTRNGNTHTAL